MALVAAASWQKLLHVSMLRNPDLSSLAFETLACIPCNSSAMLAVTPD